jgi:hypothetical protein
MTAGSTSEPPSRPLRSGWLIAAAIIALLFTLQSLRHVGHGPWGVDGSYYMQVARHVAEGDGLLTSVDVYDQGLRSLPARTNIYPLWPLLLGFASRVMPLEAASTFVPRVLFVLDLALLFALTRRLVGDAYGFAAILLLGLNSSFFSSTCYPYTEGLALACTFGALLLFDVAHRSAQPVHYALCGIVAALAFLTRSQMLLLGFALGIVMLVLTIRRRTSWRNLAAFSSGYAVTVLPWIVYLTTFIKPFRASVLIGMYSEMPGLPAFDQHVAVNGLTQYIIDRLGGLIVMFNPRSELSFAHSFGAAAFLVPIAAIYVLWRGKWIGGAFAAAIAASGLLLSAALLDAHNRFFLEWLFGYRHGLPFVLLLVVAMIQLNGPYARCIAIALVVISVVMHVPKVLAFVHDVPPDWPSAGETQLAAWLSHNDPNAIVLTTNAQALAVVSRANFRWATCEQPPSDIRRVVALVRTDYILVYEQEQRCPFSTGLYGLVQPVTSFGNAPNRLLLLKVRR